MAALLIAELSHDFLLPQTCELLLRKPELGQYLLGLLAKFRRPRRHLAWRALQREGLADQADVTPFGIRHKRSI